MKKMKMYLKDALDEISSAEKYIDIACKMKEKHPDLAKEYKDMAEQELHHKDVIEKTIAQYIKDCESEGKDIEAMKVVKDFIEDVDEEMVYNVKQKIKNY